MSAYDRVVREDFRSLNQLMEVLHKRPNNRCMMSSHSSNRDEPSFFGTKNYAEAEKMLVNGYLEILGQLKDDVKAKSKISSKFTEDLAHPIPHTAPVGYCPCVPNAIRGLPNSMISVDRKPMKRKTLSILYAMGANCDKSTKYFTEAGAALLSAIDIIEKSGVQTQIKLCFMPVEERNELAFPTVVIKNYGERYSLQKISFPLAHPSMFRRIGFKWLETTPDTKENYSNGYGRSPDYNRVEESVAIEPNTYLLSAESIQRMGCDVTKILQKLEVI